MHRIHDLIAAAESWEALDPLSELYARPAEVLQRSPSLRDALTGRWLGHSVHPMLVSLPIGLWVSAVALDASGQGRAARRLVGAGVLAAAPTALTGLADWTDTSGAERRIGTLHAALNQVAVAAHGLSWWARRSDRRLTAWVGTGVGLAAAGAAGYLGGHLAYARGVGVNTTAFQSGPEDWTRLAPVDDLPANGTSSRSLDGLSLLVVRDDGSVHVLEDRCTHRGAALSEGTVDDGCVECPWHGSRFDLTDGSVRSGPASLPQPVYEARLRDGWLEIRRDEWGGLRRNPVDARAPRR